MLRMRYKQVVQHKVDADNHNEDGKHNNYILPRVIEVSSSCLHCNVQVEMAFFWFAFPTSKPSPTPLPIGQHVVMCLLPTRWSVYGARGVEGSGVEWTGCPSECASILSERQLCHVTYRPILLHRA